jgi:phospholipid/cholesterol/gamma-HCH transport system substrate-binding protein
MGTLSRTNENAAIVAEELVHTVRAINNSPLLQRLLSDTTLPQDIHATLGNIRLASLRMNHAAAGIEATVADLRQGKGTAGLLTTDQAAREKAAAAIQNLHQSSEHLSNMLGKIDSIAGSLQAGVSGNSGALYVLLRDTAFVGKLSRSMSSIEAGTAAFSQDMEALKHNFLTRGYFRRLERQSKGKK